MNRLNKMFEKFGEWVMMSPDITGSVKTIWEARYRALPVEQAQKWDLHPDGTPFSWFCAYFNQIAIVEIARRSHLPVEFRVLQAADRQVMEFRRYQNAAPGQDTRDVFASIMK